MLEIRYSKLNPTNKYNNNYRAELYVDFNRVCSVEAMTLVEAFGSIIMSYAQTMGINIEENVSIAR